MTVGELIKALRDVPQDAIVRASIYDGFECAENEIRKVEVQSAGQLVMLTDEA